MRCACCNRALSDFESTRRHALTNSFLDLCNSCFDEVSEDADIPVITRGDLECCDDTTSELDNLYSIEYNDVYTNAHIEDDYN